MQQLFSLPRSGETWRYLPLLLIVAFGLRVIAGLTIDQAVHPDQNFQYLEQGFRLVYGYGFLPWEYVYGIRSWLIPFGVAGVIWLTDAAGFGHPAYYIPAIEVVLCAISVTLLIGIYRLAQLIADERTAIVAVVMSAFWPYLVQHAHVALPTMLAATALTWMSVLILRQPRAGSLLLFGLLSGLALGLRFQLLPALGLLNLFALLALRQRVWPVVLGNVIVIAALGVIDLATWGGFLSSFIDNFHYNFNEGISELFGVSGPDYYPKMLLGYTGGMIFPMLIGMALLWRRAWPIWVPVLVGFGLLFVPAHKEWRFVIWVMPFCMIGLAAFWVWVESRLRRWHLVWSLATGLFAVWFLAVLWIHMVHTHDVYTPKPSYTERYTILDKLRDDPDLTGVLVATRYQDWVFWGGYHRLGRPVPYMFPTLHYPTPPRYGNADRNNIQPDQATLDLSHVSHIIARRGATFEGYDVMDETANMLIWKSQTPRPPYGDKPFDFVNIMDDFRAYLSKPPRGVRFPPVPERFPPQ